jgi:proline dehydrogenase
VLKRTLILLSQSDLARTVVTRAPFTSAAARRFVAGETVDEAIAAARDLNDAGMSVTLDYLGESVGDRAEATTAADQYLEIIDRIVAHGIDGNVSLKLTQMGQDIDEAFLRRNVGRVVDRAAAHDMFVRFDMESSEYVQPTLDFFGRLWDAGARNTGIVLQSMLRRTDADVLWANERAVRVRLCKGAYAEPDTVAYPAKKDVDASFIRCMKLLLEHGNYPGIATHDEAMIEATKAFAREKDIPPDRFEFQMLFGVRRDLQRRLVDEGWRMRVYIGFGTAWYPFFMRRLAERPANVLFIARQILKG